MRIRKANRAAAACRLMLGEIRDWQTFLDADTYDLESLPRRNLKAGVADVRNRLAGQLKRFSEMNFEGMTEAKLSRLYEEIKAHRGLEMPLVNFEREYGPVSDRALAGAPRHATVVISLWGIQFQFPEDLLAKDISAALDLGRAAEQDLEAFKQASHTHAVANRNRIRDLLRQKLYAARTCVISCFNLMEAYLNGLAWQYLSDPAVSESLSKRRRGLLEDTSRTTIRDKIVKYPEIIGGKPLPDGANDHVSAFLEVIKPFRDSLIHPSPFSAPERFGGYDKLRNLYRIDIDTAELAAASTCKLIACIQEHVGAKHLRWLEDLQIRIDRQQPTEVTDRNLEDR
jgi:hypothetical protein